MTSKRKQLDEILKYAAERDIIIPADILLEIGKKDAQELIDALRVNIADIPDFSLHGRGLVPAPEKKDMLLWSTGWHAFPDIRILTPFINSGGGGGSHVGTFLRLDQGVQETVFNGAPIFDTGLISNDVISIYWDGSNALQLRSAAVDYSQLALGVVTGAGGYVYLQSNAQGVGVVLPLSFWVNSGAGAIRAMDIAPSGKVGIGTVDPDTALHVAVDNASAVIRLERNDTTIGTDDIVGRLEFEGQDAGASGVCAKLEAIGEGTDGETGWRFSNGVAGAPAETVRIDYLGNVGIGTAQPDALLHLESATGATQRLTRKDTTVTDDDIIGRIEFETQDAGAAGVAAFVQAEAEGSAGEVGLSLATGTGGAATERIRIDHHGLVTTSNFIHGSTSLYRRYYHIPLGSANPGASGATWVVASANTTGGWRLTNAAHLIRGQTDIHADWDGASNPTFNIRFMCNVNNAGGLVTDAVDIKITVYYKGDGDTSTKSQTVEIPTVIGQSPQYKQFEAEFPIVWNAAGNILESGDVISVVLNLETDTSEVDDIVITAMEFYYPTTHLGIESGDA